MKNAACDDPWSGELTYTHSLAELSPHMGTHIRHRPRCPVTLPEILWYFSNGNSMCWVGHRHHYRLNDRRGDPNLSIKFNAYTDILRDPSSSPRSTVGRRIFSRGRYPYQVIQTASMSVCIWNSPGNLHHKCETSRPLYTRRHQVNFQHKMRS